MGTDVGRIVLVQAARAFLYGFGSIILGATLASKGFAPESAGVVFTSMLAGMALMSLTMGRWGHRFPRRALYVWLLALMGIAGAAFAITSWLPLLVLAALTGTLSTDANESGPITSLEQAMIGQAPREARARIFGRYNAVAYLAGSAGALAAGGPAVFRRVFPALPPDQRWLFVFPLLALGCIVLARRLSPAVEAASPNIATGQSSRGASEPAAHRAPGEQLAIRHGLTRSRSTVRRLAALFALDSFAGGFIVQTFLVFWFRRRFGVSTEAMGAVFFGVGLLQAGSSIVAGRLAGRIGLLQTMVFTHLPSNVLLILVPFAPSFEAAVTLLLARSALSQMDVPARQAYVVSMVDPHERTAAAAYTNTARYLTRPFAPAGAGFLMQNIALTTPFVVAGGLKIIYDLILYVAFRHAREPEEEAPGA